MGNFLKDCAPNPTPSDQINLLTLQFKRVKTKDKLKDPTNSRSSGEGLQNNEGIHIQPQNQMRIDEQIQKTNKTHKKNIKEVQTKSIKKGHCSNTFLQQQKVSNSKPNSKQHNIVDTTNKKQVHSSSSRIRRGKGGIQNLFNTCYLSSGLQCLYQTQALSKNIERYDTNFVKLFKEMSQHLSTQPDAFKPKKIKSLVQNFNQKFKGNSQQDSGELVSTVLNIIHEETDSVKTPQITKIQYEEKETDEELYERYKEKFRKMSNSVVDRVAVGCFKTTYQCSKCDYQKRLFQRFNTVYLPIRKPQNKAQKICLKDCFDDFRAQEQIDWDCPKCNEQTPHKKYMRIYRPNNFLILCLKRFNEDNSKIKTPVSVPVQLGIGSTRNKGIKSQPKYNYELYAAIVHFGEFNSGHYVACCYDYRNQFWAEYNDERVTIIELKQLEEKVKNAYLLFYQIKQKTV